LSSSAAEPSLSRSVGLLSAVSINMTQMCGIGPFITISAIIAAMGGPQAILGWVAGTIIALADGLVWAELGAAMPGTGGTYVYLREAFQRRTGLLMPFLFVWCALLAMPLNFSTGVIGLVQYLGYLVPHLTWIQAHGIALGIVCAIVILLYRRIETVQVVTLVLWGIMLVTIAAVVVASFTHFRADLAFDFPPGAFDLNRGFFAGLGSGLLISIYNYIGYHTTAYMGDELRDPARTMPASIMLSIFGMLAVYLALFIGVTGVVPWRELSRSGFVASLVVEHAWGRGAAAVITCLILVTALASVLSGLLGGSRVAYGAAQDGVFFRRFGELHPKHRIPHRALVAMGAVIALGTFFRLTDVIAVLISATLLVQSIGQIVALTVLRRERPDLPRPYRQWLYPLPSVVALLGWTYMYVSAGWLSIGLSLAWLALGCTAYFVWTRHEHPVPR
jgi:amino acid transporter